MTNPRFKRTNPGDQCTVTKRAASYDLGRIYGYERGYPSLLPFQREVADRIHDAIQQCFDNYAIMFNTTSSLCFFSYVLGEDLDNMGMTNNMDNNFPTIIQMAKLDEPLYTNILSQAHKVAKANFSDEHISLFKKGKQPVPIWHDGTGPFYLPHNCVELLSVSIGDHNEYYLCCNLFHPKWAINNKLPMWIAFEINSPNDGSTTIHEFTKFFGEPNNSHPSQISPDGIESKIVVKSYKPVGKFILQLKSTTQSPKYSLQVENN